jgi:DNA-binding beta-propeller fold protein YncE
LNSVPLKYYPFILVVSFLLFSLSSCMDDELWKESHKPNLSVDEVISGGVIILNEGNFMYGNASLSYYNPQTRKLTNDVFYRQNGIPLGDVAESAEVYDGELFIVLNNSGKVVAVNMGKYPALKAFDFTHKITGLTSPRYIHFFNKAKAYISDLYAKHMYIVDPSGYEVKNTIPLSNNNPEYYQHPTEQMIAYKDYIFTNCYSFDNKILVINSKTDRLIDSIEVLAQPNSMVMDKNNKLWVLCDGGFHGSSFGNTLPGLVRIDLETRTIEKIFIMNGDHWPSELTINGSRDTMYFINQDVWRMSVNDVVLPGTPFIPATDEKGTKLFYSIGVNPANSEIYLGDAIDHVQNGVVYRFSPDSTPLDTLRVGIIPGFFCFPGDEN